MMSRLTRSLSKATLALASTAALFSAVPMSAAAQTRTAFVHLFEWKWTDIARECESYLGPKGFAAVQVSPPNEHNQVNTGDGAPYPWWMRYQPVGYSLDRSRSGTRAEFVNMVNRCNAVGVGIYVDAVINHMSGGNSGTSSAGNSWTNKNYSRVPYGSNDFHSTCGITNYNDAANVQNCELSGLQDLNTGASYVQGKISDYLVDLVNIGVKGFRVDAAKHINPMDLNTIINNVNSRVTNKPYWFLEVIGAPGEAVQPSQYLGLNGNLVNITEFAYGRELAGKFIGSGNLSQLKTFGPTWGLLASDKAVAFVDNHDNQRGHGGGGNNVTYHNGSTYDLANVFMLAWPYGYPSIMSSYAFNKTNNFDTSYGPPHNTGGATKGPWDGVAAGGQPACFSQTVGGWVCEHRWRPIGNMVAWRNAVVSNQNVTDWWDNGANLIGFGRGDRGFVVINKESTAVSRSFKTSMSAGRYCDIISGDYTANSSGGTCAGNVVTIDANGNGTFAATAFGAAAIHAGAKLGTSGGGGTTPPTTTTAKITFNEIADTNFGQNIYVIGSVTAIGSWNTANAVKLDYISGSGTRGNWSKTVTFPANTSIQYKYIKKDNAGNVVWESGTNRTVTSGAANSIKSVNDTWK